MHHHRGGPGRIAAIAGPSQATREAHPAAADERHPVWGNPRLGRGQRQLLLREHERVGVLRPHDSIVTCLYSADWCEGATSAPHSLAERGVLGQLGATSPTRSSCSGQVIAAAHARCPSTPSDVAIADSDPLAKLAPAKPEFRVRLCSVSAGLVYAAVMARVDQVAEAFTGLQSTTDTILIGRPSVVASNWKFTMPPCLAHPSSVFAVRCWSSGVYASTLRNPQTLVAPEPLHILVIDHSGALGRQHAGRGGRLRSGCAG